MRKKNLNTLNKKHKNICVYIHNEINVCIYE